MFVAGVLFMAVRLLSLPASAYKGATTVMQAAIRRSLAKPVEASRRSVYIAVLLCTDPGREVLCATARVYYRVIVDVESVGCIVSGKVCRGQCLSLDQ